jgi:hypothetical protein
MTDPVSLIRAVQRFAGDVTRLEGALSGLPPGGLELNESPGEWTIRQIVHHLADDGDVWCYAIKKAIATPGARLRFEGFPGNKEWSTELGFVRRPVDPARALFRAHRAYISEMVGSFPTVGANTVVVTDESGQEVQPLNVLEMLEMLSDHLEEHAATIVRIRIMHGV